MRSLLLLQFVALLWIGCGPSAAEIKTAKTATYRGDASAMFDEIIAATQDSYKLADATKDDGRYALITQAQWYNPEGGRQSAGAGDVVQIIDHSIRLEIVVELVDADPGFVVTVTPTTFQHIAGSPQPRELKPDDPNLPGWVQGRVETLQLEIHKRLQKYAVQ